MTDVDRDPPGDASTSRFRDATTVLIDALRSSAEHLTGDTIADVDEAMSAYERALNDALHTQGGPYPVTGRRGWVWLDDAPAVGDRTVEGEIRCQSRAMRESDGVPHRCRLDAAHDGRGRRCDFEPEQVAGAAKPSRVGDLIGPNDTGIPADVLEVVDSQHDTWRRAVGEERYAHEDGEEPDRSQEYDWVAGGGGWSTTRGVLEWAPLRVTKVAEQAP